jgi:hypothetical protein
MSPLTGIRPRLLKVLLLLLSAESTIVFAERLPHNDFHFGRWSGQQFRNQPNARLARFFVGLHP